MSSFGGPRHSRPKRGKAVMANIVTIGTSFVVIILLWEYFADNRAQSQGIKNEVNITETRAQKNCVSVLGKNIPPRPIGHIKHYLRVKRMMGSYAPKLVKPRMPQLPANPCLTDAPQTTEFPYICYSTLNFTSYAFIEMSTFMLGGFSGDKWYDYDFYLDVLGFQNSGWGTYHQPYNSRWGWVAATTNSKWDTTSYGWYPKARNWTDRIRISKQKSNGNALLVFVFNTTRVPLEIKPPPLPHYPTPPCYGLSLCVYKSGEDPCTVLLVCPNTTALNNDKLETQPGLELGPKTKTKMRIKIFNKPLTPDDWFSVTTGISAKVNNWLLMAEETAKPLKTNCVVCLGPRPILRVIPAAMEPRCLIRVMTEDNPGKNCTQWDKTYPLASATKNKPLFDKKVTKGDFTCVNLTGKVMPIGNLSVNWCMYLFGVNPTFNPKSRADVWWWCGGDKLYDRLPKDVTGLCALVSLLLPVSVHQVTAQELLNSAKSVFPEDWKREKRSVSWQGEDPTYIDAIGVPRGVPDEYKLVDQVASGFESIFLWITPNKNIDRINYIHYNVQKLGNYTQQGFEAVHEQLSATSVMTFQNRLAVDMILAERGGVCALFQDQCCTYIPNNTAMDGSLTRAIDGLRSMNKRMKEQSGVDSTIWDNWMNAFGSYKTLISSILISIAVFVSILTLCGCCCIPCIRSLLTRIIERAVGEQDKYGQYAMLSVTEPSVQDMNHVNTALV